MIKTVFTLSGKMIWEMIYECAHQATGPSCPIYQGP